MTIVKAFHALTMAGAAIVLISAAEPARAAAPTQTAMLPDRYLQCVLGRSKNVDQNLAQTTSDVGAEGRYRLAIRLPARAAHAGTDPDPTDIPAPVDPRTQVLDDPAGLTKAMSATFSRVEDLWPRRVEMLAPILNSSWIQFIAISAINPATQTARLFMAPVKDAATMDLQKIYQGDCKVTDRLTRSARR